MKRRAAGWFVAALAVSACGDNDLPAAHSHVPDAHVPAPDALLTPVPTVFEYEGGGHDGWSSVDYAVDETGELWANAYRRAGHHGYPFPHRFDRVSSAWIQLDAGGMQPWAASFGHSSDGKLLLASGLYQTGSISTQWHYLAPGATSLQPPIASMIDVDGNGSNDISAPGVMDAAGRLYVTMRTPNQTFLGRIQPDAPSIVENVLDLPAAYDAIGYPIAAPNGAVYVVHEVTGTGVVIDRFAPDGSGPTRVLEGGAGKPPIPGRGWQWFPPEIGYVALGPQAPVYRLTPDGMFTLFADNYVGDYDSFAGLSYLADGSVLGFIKDSETNREGLFVRAGDADPATPWRKLAAWSTLYVPIPGPVGVRRWVADRPRDPSDIRAYELILE